MSAIKKAGGYGRHKEKNKEDKEKAKTAKIGHNQRKTQEEHQHTSTRMCKGIDNKIGRRRGKPRFVGS
jgi:hypothetical protein